MSTGIAIQPAPASEPGSSEPVSSRPPRRPLVTLALFLSAGMVLDRYLSPPMAVWLASLILVTLAIAPSWRLRHWAVTQAMLLIGVTLLGASWHHRHHLFALDDIGNFAGEEARLCQLKGVVRGAPTRTVAQSPHDWDQTPKWKLVVSVQALRDGGSWVDASGLLTAHLQGDPPACQAGDTIQLLGWLATPPAPLNEAEFNYREYLLTHKIRALVYCDSSDCVQVLHRGTAFTLTKWFDRLRESSSAAIQRHLLPGQAALAEAVLIGSRQGLSREELEPYVESGTMHLLVISGMHLVWVATMLWWCCGLFDLAPRPRSFVVLLFVWFYVGITGANPPVVRAAVLTSFYLGAFAVGRPSLSLNGLAAAVLVLLAYDPANLFRIGPQLSFLAVLAILLYASRKQAVPDDRASELLAWWQRRVKSIGRSATDVTVFSATIWLLMTPLILHHFHLLSPISIPLTVLLMVFLAPALVFGLFLLATAGVPILAWLTPVFAVGCSLSLWAMQWLVQWVEYFRFGYVYVQSPPLWWVLGLYGLLLLPWLMHGGFQLGPRFACALVSWVAVGIGALLLPGKSTQLEYHQLAVGHGNCAVIQFPQGQTVIYDCGSLKGAEVSERLVAPWLWNRGVHRVHALILSHADVDHFNGVRALSERIPIDEVFVSPHFVTSKEPAVEELVDHLVEEGIPVRFVWDGDRIGFGQYWLRILQPQAASKHPTDNSASIVASLEHRGIRLLMTGDVEKVGLQQLVNGPAEGTDILIAPHHGSRTSNTPEVARWADARLVISSQGFRPNPETAMQVYTREGTEVLRTDEDGTVSCQWTSEGVLVRTYHTGKHFLLRPRPLQTAVAAEDW